MTPNYSGGYSWIGTLLPADKDDNAIMRRPAISTSFNGRDSIICYSSGRRIEYSRTRGAPGSLGRIEDAAAEIGF